jgi:hypothetical protein
MSVFALLEEYKIISAQAPVICVLTSCSVLDDRGVSTLFLTHPQKRKSMGVRFGDLRVSFYRTKLSFTKLF